MESDNPKPKMKFKIINAEMQVLLREERPEARQAFNRLPFYMQQQEMNKKGTDSL